MASEDTPVRLYYVHENGDAGYLDFQACELVICLLTYLKAWKRALPWADNKEVIKMHRGHFMTPSIVPNQRHLQFRYGRGSVLHTANDAINFAAERCGEGVSRVIVFLNHSWAKTDGPRAEAVDRIVDAWRAECRPGT